MKYNGSIVIAKLKIFVYVTKIYQIKCSTASFKCLVKKCPMTHHVLDPFVGLSLRVNEQGPPPGELHYHTVLHGECVSRQPGYLPVSNLDRIREDGDEICVAGVRDIVDC